ncbi:MAG: hypothetical protein ABIE94_06600 [archaeon]
MNPSIPVFVKIEEYKEILDIIDVIRSKIDTAKNTLSKISELKDQEDQKIEEWSKNLDEVERKIDFVDKTLFEPRT